MILIYEIFNYLKNHYATSIPPSSGRKVMTQNLLIGRLAQGAVDRCRERIMAATKRTDQVVHRDGEKGTGREPLSFTGALKRFRGL